MAKRSNLDTTKEEVVEALHNALSAVARYGGQIMETYDDMNEGRKGAPAGMKMAANVDYFQKLSADLEEAIDEVNER